MNTTTNRQAIAQVKLKYRESTYRFNQNKFEKIEKKYLEQGKTYDVLSIEDNGTFKLLDGTYLFNLPSHHYELTYGKVEIIGNEVPVYSPNGYLLRYVKKGQKFPVYNIKFDTISKVTRYYISHGNEVLTSNTEIEFLNKAYINQLSSKIG